MKANKKKIIVLVSMVLLLVGTGVLNYFLNTNVPVNSGQGSGSSVTVPTFFEMFRSERVVTRQAEIDALNEIIDATNSTEAMIDEAREIKMALARSIDTEFAIETLIKAKGMPDAVVTITKNNVYVVVQKAELSLEESIQILNIITTETDYTAEDIVVYPYV
ncbi:MAG: SpoIIIAH-like family protein [Firmicutes bacterium]|nr:SpoIIIAH-like family protein [Bacillota bacterium]